MQDRFATLRTVGHALGGLLIAMSVPLVVPLLFAVAYNEFTTSALLGFTLPASLCLATGLVLRFSIQPGAVGEIQAMLLCGLSWFVLSLFGALPFLFLTDASYLDALFETVSGFTTTGITMFSGLDEMPKSLLIWRALTQWIGGLGIITFFLAATRARPNVHQLIRAESHKIAAPRPVPGLFRTVRFLWLIYALLTSLVMGGLLVCGVGLFDAIAHALTTVSTGGFSTHDASIAHFQSAAVEYVLIAGMALSGVSFLVHFRLLRGDVSSLWDRPETRAFWALLVLFTVVVYASGRSSDENLRTVAFQVTSLSTTTGYATAELRVSFLAGTAPLLFLLMMFTGGCVGSTSGGFKVLRIVLLAKLLGRQLFRFRTPRAALSDVRYAGELVPREEVDRVAALFFAWLSLLAVGAIITAALSSHGSLAAASGMFSALNNIGPCYIPAEEMSELSAPIKTTYMVGMLAGRLEIFPIALLFSRKAWVS